MLASPSLQIFVAQIAARFWAIIPCELAAIFALHDGRSNERNHTNRRASHHQQDNARLPSPAVEGFFHCGIIPNQTAPTITVEASEIRCAWREFAPRLTGGWRIARRRHRIPYYVSIVHWTQTTRETIVSITAGLIPINREAGQYRHVHHANGGNQNPAQGQHHERPEIRRAIPRPVDDTALAASIRSPGGVRQMLDADATRKIAGRRPLDLDRMTDDRGSRLPDVRNNRQTISRLSWRGSAKRSDAKLINPVTQSPRLSRPNRIRLSIAMVRELFHLPSIYLL